MRKRLLDRSGTGCRQLVLYPIERRPSRLPVALPAVHKNTAPLVARQYANAKNGTSSARCFGAREGQGLRAKPTSTRLSQQIKTGQLAIGSGNRGHTGHDPQHASIVALIRNNPSHGAELSYPRRPRLTIVIGILLERRQEGPGKQITVCILPRAYNSSADQSRILDCRYPKQLNPPFGLALAHHIRYRRGFVAVGSQLILCRWSRAPAPR
jgi:hypothetical protein